MDNSSIIQVKHGTRTQIAKVFGCTSAYIGQCLNGDYPDSTKAKKIRYTAVTQFDGVELVPANKKEN